jgi:hypothetical protein
LMKWMLYLLRDFVEGHNIRFLLSQPGLDNLKKNCRKIAFIKKMVNMHVSD